VISFSAVIPTYNRADSLVGAVESVVHQSYPAREIIVVDDGSTDDTAAVCRTVPAGVKTIRQENAGVSAARNRGVREASADFVAFLDSDDRWMANKLEVQAAVLDALPRVGWTVGGCELVDSSGTALGRPQSFEGTFPVLGENRISAREFFARFLEHVTVSVGGSEHDVFHGDAFEMLCHGNVILPSTLAVRRHLFLKEGGFDESLRMAEETEFAHRLSVVSPLAIVMTPLARRQVGEEDVLTADRNKFILIENARRSLEGAVARRGTLTPSEVGAYRAGLHALTLRRAYAELSDLDRHGARRTLRQGWREDLPFSGRSAVIYLAALLPAFMLRLLHRAKRTVRRIKSGD
jgi:GT2 family glycosyltransferase